MHPTAGIHHPATLISYMVLEKLKRMSAVPSPAHRNLAQYYHWAICDRGMRIYLNATMVDRLKADIRGGLESAEGTRETGGILLGNIETDGDQTNAFIEDFVPVSCSYSTGPWYSLSEEDTVHFEAALLRAALAACDSNAPGVVGYYRSHARDALSLAASDLALIGSYFTETSSIFLLVKGVLGSTACTAGFFFWEDGCVQPDFSSLEVALGRLQADSEAPNEDPAAETDEVARMFEQATANVPAVPAVIPAFDVTATGSVAREPRAPAQVALSPWPGMFLRFAIIVLATVALVASAIRYLGAPRQAREDVAASSLASGLLGLQVEPRSSGLLVSWNQSAPEIADALRGVLSIHDGRLQKSWNLDKSQLSTGSVLYIAAGEDVEVRLEVYNAQQQSAVQSMRVLRPAGPDSEQ
jgi:hypothetical protein